MTLDTHAVRDRLNAFAFTELFVEHLGWSNPASDRTETIYENGVVLTRREVAQLAQVKVFEVQSSGDTIPNADLRAQIYREVAQQYHENLLIFVNADRSQSLWYWVQRDGGKPTPRQHHFFKDQPADLFLSKISSMRVGMEDLDAEGNIPVVDVMARLRQALDVEQVTKKFYAEFRIQHEKFVERIEGIDDERDRNWYGSVMLNRLMFVYFLQKKGFLDGGRQFYLQEKLEESRTHGDDRYYSDFLNALFFEGFAKPEAERDPDDAALIGRIRYLGGSLFLQHPVEERWNGRIRIGDAAFDDLLGLFGRFSWNLDDTPGGQSDEINPDVLGYIFEKYINQKAFGAYYTPTQITEYLCEQTVHKLVLEQMKTPAVAGKPAQEYDSVQDLMFALDAPRCRTLLFEVLPKLSLLDPACGSGAFLIAALKTLTVIYHNALFRIPGFKDRNLQQHYQEIVQQHGSLDYYIKKKIIAENLYGVDIMEEATEIARLRLYLALVASVERVEDLEPLPNIDFNILTGNSLIGLLRVNEADFNKQYAQTSMFQQSYGQAVAEKNRLIGTYRDTALIHDDLRDLRDTIQQHRDQANAKLNNLLLDEFRALKIKFEQANWDVAKNKAGKATKRDLTIADIEALHPFHWGYEFDEVMNQRGGFDAIITNPPWEVFQADEKEFFQQFLPEIQKKKIRIEEWRSQFSEFMGEPETREAWLEYVSGFSHVSAYFKTALQYRNQQSIIDGKRAASKINLYTYFTEQSFNLLRGGGECGIVIPSGIYTDRGTTQLRKMLLAQAILTGLFCFENRKAIFEGVHRSFKFVVLTFEKGGQTSAFPAAFMRHEVDELEQFPEQGALHISVDLVHRLSPDTLSIMEFKSDLDVQIAEKMLRFPLLGEHIDGTWNLSLTQELNMTGDSDLFETAPGPGRLPLYEGKMIHQFTHQWAEPRYWVDEKAGRARILGRRSDVGQRLDYQDYRLGFRDVASSTNERTMISSIVPPQVFSGNTLITTLQFPTAVLPSLVSILDSFAVDFIIRKKVTSHCNMFYVYQLPVPRLTEADREFPMLVERAAKLICTTPEFDDLAQEAGLAGHADGVTDPEERARLRAEIDGIVAHLYGLTEEEFAHILTTFPIVDQQVKDAAMGAYHQFAPIPADPEIVALIESEEGPVLEFKESVFWDDENTPNQKIGEKIIWKAVAAFMNTEGGDLLIGIHDKGHVVGLAPDYARVTRRPDVDGWQQRLAQSLMKGIGRSRMSYVTIAIEPVGYEEICHIRVTPSPDPVWLTEGATQQRTLYVRVGNTSQPYIGKDAEDYVRRHWK